ncbi:MULTISPECIES: phage tail sheath subtilisin-like domain-containing protein [unclassified Thalassospira]|uniref:phage tail sheath subtilisin-like domain-containing protein n=1 Tax=unclassified Thalassospira TaxID=2648997 RepID=UPI001B226E39|nr:phage tail sheath subtilisin-like domain-containing protein [Thalassospira sp.]MBO6771760.1 phage tail sheath subtilisin-like domain-containing protein [Thalassospira sp.]
MSISFDSIPTNLRVPFVYAEFDNTNAVSGPALMPYRNLVIGQRIASGQPVAALTPIRVTSPAQAKNYFGAGSMLAQMLERQLQNNSVTETWAIALDDDAAAQAATGALTVGGTVSAGVIYLYIGGRRVKVGVSGDDALSDIASNIVDAITANTDLSVSAAVDGVTAEKVNLTARNKGVAGNDLDIRVNYYDGESLPEGLTLTITAMSGGQANPDIEDVWAAIGDEHYNVITNPYTDAANLTALETELVDRWGPLRMIEAMAFSAATGTHSALGTLGDSRNSPHVSIMNGAGSPSPTWEIAAAVAGKVSYYANIDPARPFQTLTLDGILPPKTQDRFTLQENNLLLFDGISTFMVDDGGLVRIQRLITTYKTNPQGAEDISYLDVNTPLTLGYLRYDFRNYILRKYPRHKLGNDSTNYGAGQAIMTPKLGKAEAIARFRVWEEQGLVENIDQFKNDLICERNESDPNRLDWYLPPDLMNQFRVGGAKIGFIL